MKKNQIYACIVLLCALATSCTDNNYYRLSGYAQGGVYNVKYKGADEKPGVLQVQVDSLLKEIDFTLSGYNQNSLLSHFNAGDTLTLTPMFARMYELSFDTWKESQGAFDPAYAPLYNIWGFGFKSSRFPEEDEIKACLDTYGMDKLKDPSQINALVGKRITGQDFLKDKGSTLPQLNFNAIAQGFSCDLIAELLESHHTTDYLIDIGEIFCKGNGPSGKGWTIGIDNPADGNNTPGADIRQTWNSAGETVGVVTSGNYRKFYIKDGKKYSHTIDPKTGRPVSHNLLSATVIASTASTADALATFFMVIGDGKAREYLSSHPEIKACLITEEGVWTNW